MKTSNLRYEYVRYTHIDVYVHVDWYANREIWKTEIYFDRDRYALVELLYTMIKIRMQEHGYVVW